MWASELFCKKQHAKLKQQRIYKTRYLYDDMTDDDWAAYTKQTHFICDVMSLDDTSLDNISDINEQWNNVQYAIKLAAKDNILQRTSVIKNDPCPIKNSSIYRNMRFLHNLLSKLDASPNRKIYHISQVILLRHGYTSKPNYLQSLKSLIPLSTYSI